mmetsp:Transcript_12880/g.37816  ORF Transcript_12880/g.37816 Transcript_12880/m.37816 type:complete len:223 (-) Transcript_12880:238-906(-)
MMARYDAARTMGRPGVAACSVSSPSGKAIRSVVPCEMSLAADMMAKRSMSSMWYTSLPRGLTPASLAAMRLARWRMPSRPAKRSIASSFSVSSCSTRLVLRWMTRPLGAVIILRKRTKRGACSAAASLTNWRTVSSETCAQTERLFSKTVLIRPVGEMSCETSETSVCSRNIGMCATSSDCISGEPEHMALSSRYAARSTPRASTSPSVGLRSTGRCSSCSA